MSNTIFLVLFTLAGVAICVNAIVGWIPPEHPQLAGRDPNQPNEPLWSRWLAARDPKFQKGWAVDRRIVRIVSFLLGLVFAAFGIVMLTR
jgi:hypothetical protein